MSAPIWSETEALPEKTTWLLEASAGTGKTHQIAGLFVRLVAELNQPVDRILAITFTNAATAELRERVRERLRLCQRCLVGEEAALEEARDDAILQRLLASGAPHQARARLEAALRDFDRAAISTIHGFSQRMLQELSFESGQDSDLELLADASEVVERVADDTLATLYAGASPLAVARYAAAGFTREGLLETARAMTGATTHLILPEVGGTLLDERARVEAMAARAAALGVRWNGDEGGRAEAAMEADSGAPRLNANRLPRGSIPKLWNAVGQWLQEGAPATTAKALAELGRLHASRLAALWKHDAEDVCARPWYPLCAEFEAFSTENARFNAAFAPLALFARDVRGRVEAEIERRRALTFDGMLSRLAERVGAEGGAASPLAARIRARFDAALVDEFQDTDAAQWQVLQAAFHGHVRLFLIGDPKQAIYAFRGADVNVYLRAAQVEGALHRTLGANWRSDPPAVEAMNQLWRPGSGPFDEPLIDSVAVEARKGVRLRPAGPGLEVRWLDARARSADAAEGETLSAKDPALAARLATAEARRLLDDPAVELRDDEGWRRIQPADFAILVNAHHEAQAMRRELQRAGIPAIAASRESVFETPVAGWLAAWLDAVAGAGRDRDARAAVVTPLFGWTAEKLAWALDAADRAEDEPAALRAEGVDARTWNAWTERLRAAAERWPGQGFARTFDREASELGVYPRVLRLPEGERHATDLRHLFELLHVEERSRRCGPAALATWLRAQAAERDETTAQRLESDARAVKIETIHVSKGLQYPLVLLPFGWSARAEKDDGGPLVLRRGERSRLDLHPVETPARDEALREARLEERREGLRKLYVALTRAKHRTIVWYGPVGTDGQATSATALGRLLLRPPGQRGHDDEALPVFGKKATPNAYGIARERLDALANASGGSIVWRPEMPPPRWAPWRPTEPPAVEPANAPWPPHRTSLSGPWLVTSYTGLSASSAVPDQDEKLGLEPPPQPASDASPPTTGPAVVAVARPAFAEFPEHPRLAKGRGTEYGSFVHEVLEALDFESGHGKDGRTAEALVTETGARLGFRADSEPVVELRDHLPALLETPLDSSRAGAPLETLPRGFTLGQLAARDRLDELAFDLRLGEGTRWRRADDGAPADRESLLARAGCVDAEAVYAALERAPRADERGLSAWLEYQRGRRDAGKALIGSIAGILTGSIDLVFRAGPRGAERYYVVDYKTNRIGASQSGHYASPWLDWEMAIAGYPLQALLYTLALHRHLETRLATPHYDYDVHMGGYLYLFLRGFSGARTPRDPRTGHCLGVFGERWPKDVVLGLDRALTPLWGDPR